MPSMITTQTYQIGDNVKLMREMPPETFDTIITSPPYWSLRDYGVDGQIGLEGTLEEYHARLLEVTAECMRVLKPTGVMFWNHGDSYGGNQGRGTGKGNEHRQMISQRNNGDKCLAMQNERLIIRMIDDQGWTLRNRIIWNKPNGMPSSVTDRFSNKYEPVYMLVKSKKYWFDLDAVRVPHVRDWRNEGWAQEVHSKNPKGNSLMAQHGGNKTMAESFNLLGKNPGDVWTIPTQPYPESHFATFPTTLIEPMIKAACPEGGTVLDPFCGSGTVLEVCRLLNRNAIGLELNPEYEPLIKERSMAHTPPLAAYIPETP